MPTAIRTDDPKGAIGATKCPLHLLPPKPMQDIAWVLRSGADKYGEFNWLYNNVCASTYVGAIKRHLDSWWSGELLDPESGISHLAHVAASAMIVMDAQKHGTLNLNIPYGVPIAVSPSPDGYPQEDADFFQDFEGMKDRFEDAFGLSPVAERTSRAQRDFAARQAEADLQRAETSDLRIPDHMLPLPDAPEGYTWEPRGFGWRGEGVKYAFWDGQWFSVCAGTFTTGADPNTFYIEAVPAAAEITDYCECGYRLVRDHTTNEMFCENCTTVAYE